MAKVSIIIPVYNTEKYLRKCLDSACRQTLRDIEIICVNDGSRDNSLCILQEYAAADNRIRIINFEKNRGVSAARNAGIDAASGEYIGFLDSDDYLDLNFYEKLYEQTKSGADIVKGKIKRVKQSCNDVEDFFLDYVDDSERIAGNKGYFLYCFSTAIYSSILLKDGKTRFYEDLAFAEDLCFVVAAVIKSDFIAVVEDAYYYYEISDTSVIKNIPSPYNYIRSHVLATDRIMQNLNSTQVEDSIYKAAYCMLLYFVTSSTKYFHLFSNEGKREIGDSVFDYVMKNCQYPEEVYELYKKYIHESDVCQQKYQISNLRKKIQQKQLQQKQLKYLKE